MSPPNQPHRQRHWICALQIAERRRSLGLTQQDVVDRLADLGVATTNRSLSAMEHGQGIDVGRLPEMAIALDCTVTFLLGLTGNPLSWAPDDAAQDAAAAERNAVEPCCRLHYPRDFLMPVAGGTTEHAGARAQDPVAPQVIANSRPSLMRFAAAGEPAEEPPRRVRAVNRA